MIFDTQTNRVRLTQAELNRIRKHAAQQRYYVGQITNTDKLDKALIKACSTDEINTLSKRIEAHIK